MINLGLGRPQRPGDSRGILPLLAAAAIASVIRGGVGAIQANQSKQRNKGFINANYRIASERLNREQSNARQDIAESLNARGLAQGGGVSASPIHTAMVGTTRQQKVPIMVGGPNGAMKAGERDVTVENDDKTMQAQGPAASTLGESEVHKANEEMGIERLDLDQQRDQALSQNKAEYNNALLGAGVSAIGTGMDVYSAGKDLQSMQAAKAAQRSQLHSMMLSGSAYDGVHPNDPLGDPTSAWSTQQPHPGGKLADPSQTNASFNAYG